MQVRIQQSIHYVLRIFYTPVKRFLPFQVYTYLACGAANTFLNIVLFAFFYQVILPQPGFYIGNLLFASYTISLVIAFMLTVPTGFWFNKNFAFRQEEDAPGTKGKTQGIKYFLVVLQGLLSDYLIMVCLILYCHLHPTLAKIISTVVVLSLNYLLQKHFTFKNRVSRNKG